MLKSYIEQMNQDSREYDKLQAGYTFALCYAMVCSQYGN